ncbi:hypothetical protein CP973_07090 [Streptomyces albofaciens JCM 4342]|uniref:hypothetical protein n=1 Tax=Streptomyces albofaciens TaxID=66866 RepID=UPI000AD7F937|nr:hypothetical protein [Streptomyces albofaciens]KAA6221760.1 hypothetical protein CP973_07090 [Streptomyces albofaciens JCM 4342]
MSARTYRDGEHTMCGHCNLIFETLTAEDAHAYPDLRAEFKVGEPLCCERAAADWRAERGRSGGAE